MRRLALAAAAFLLLLLPSSAGAGGTAVAYVTAKDENRLVAVDLGTNRLLARIPVANGPQNVAATFDGRTVVITSPAAGRVTVVDGRSLRVRRVFRGFAYPHDVELTASGRFAWVTDERRDQVVVLDLSRGRVAGRIRVAARPHDLAVTDQVLVTHGPDGSSLTAIDPTARHVTRRIPVGRGPRDIVFRPDSAEVFLTYWDSGSVARFDWGVGRVRFRRTVGQSIGHVALDFFSGNRVWATDQRGGRLLLLDARTGRTLRTVGGCPGARDIGVIGNGSAAAACEGSGRLLVHHAPTDRSRSIRVGRGVHGVAVAVIP